MPRIVITEFKRPVLPTKRHVELKPAYRHLSIYINKYEYII